MAGQRSGGPDRSFTAIPDNRPDDRPWPAMTWPVPSSTELVGTAVRLTLVDPQTDADALFSALDHDQVWRHVAGRSATVHQFEEALDAVRRNPTRHQWLVRSLGGSVLGTTSYLDVSVHDARLEIGATLYTPAVWGSAVNPDAKLLLLTYAFESLSVGRVQLKTDVRNERSQRAIARLGARYEGLLRRYQRRGDDTVRDTALFSITAEEYPEVREGLEARLAPP